MSDFAEKLEKAYELSLIELDKRKNGIEREASLSQLRDVILPELEDLMTRAGDRPLPPKEKRYLNSYAHAFKAWGWNMKKPTELFVLLAELNRAYQRLE